MAVNDITNLTKGTDETVLLVSETGYSTADTFMISAVLNCYE